MDQDTGRRLKEGTFSGPLRTEWLDNHRDMVILEDCFYMDLVGRVFACREGDVIDGSSTPKILWPLFGSPFVGRHRRGTAFHDCSFIRKLYPQDICDGMMLEIFVKDGVCLVKRRIMYRAVRTWGGPAYEDEDPNDRRIIVDGGQ